MSATEALIDHEAVVDTASPAKDDEATERTPKKHLPNYSCRGITLGVVIFIVLNLLAQGFAFLGHGDFDLVLGEGTNLKIVQTVSVIAIGMNILVFIPSFLFTTEKFYDLTGSFTFATCTLYSLFAGSVQNEGDITPRALAASIMTLMWCARMGFFLFSRVMQVGKDRRFDSLKVDFFKFINMWVLQGLWVFLTAFPTFIINSDQSVKNKNLVATDFIGIAIWVFGFSIEIIADYQKSQWRKSENKKHPFIDYGLWYYSRHPNYFGEMTLWWGIFFLSIEVLTGKQYVAVFSPIFVYLLINFVSGVSLLEIGSDKRFGHLPEYWEYKRTTNSLLFLPKGWGGAKKAGPKKPTDGTEKDKTSENVGEVEVEANAEEKSL